MPKLELNIRKTILTVFSISLKYRNESKKKCYKKEIMIFYSLELQVNEKKWVKVKLIGYLQKCLIFRHFLL